MKAISKVKREYGGVALTDVPVPTIQDNEILVRVKYASICGSDVHAYKFAPTHHFIETPVIMGHEFAGEVAEIGTKVKDFSKGNRVVAEAVDYCGNCESCLRGDGHICESFQIRGMHQNGVFAEYVVVKEQYLHTVPDTVELKDACLTEPISVLCHAVLERSSIKPGNIVMVTGPGPIGLLAAQVIQSVGATPFIVGIDSDEEMRLPLARKLGFETINISSQSLSEEIQALYGRSTVHAVVECSGAPVVFQTALDIVMKGGSITLVGLFPKNVEANMSIAVRKELSIFASFASNAKDFKRALELLEEGVIQPSELVSLYQPEEALKAFEDTILKKVAKPIIQF